MTLFLSPGAPTTAVYKFVRCNPEGDQANCVTQQSPEMAWNPDLPGKLPASAAQYLYVPMCCGKMEEEETPMISEQGESPGDFLPEEGSGGYEGSAFGGVIMAHPAFGTAESETGSGEKDMDPQTGNFNFQLPSSCQGPPFFCPT
uniref:Uncharacterized protein n=1 Tax=Seriola dumerili TaxID=41447 RepID=A0A3B4VH32_SERDU